MPINTTNHPTKRKRTNMALASSLIPDQSYPVRSGDYAGQQAIIVDNTPVPDGEPNQRKILVAIDGSLIYILPRQIDDGTPTRSQVLANAVAGGIPTNQPVVSTGSVYAPAPTAPTAVTEHAPITDPMDPRLDAYRPDPSIVKRYLSRKLPGGLKDTEVLLEFRKEKRNVLLVGETQSGKTMLVQVLACLAAKEAGLPKPYPVFTLSGSAGISDFDLFGQVTSYSAPGEPEKLVWLPGIVDLACRVPSFLYLDEVNMMSERVTASLHSITDERRCFINRNKAVPVENDGFLPEIVSVHPDTWVIGTYNDGYAGAGALQEAFTNRFIHLPWDYDNAVESKLISSPVVRALGSALRIAKSQGAIRTPVGTTALVTLQEMAYKQGVEFACWAFTGMFPSRDRAKVEGIIVDRSFKSLLSDEVTTSSGESKADDSEVTSFKAEELFVSENSPAF